MVFPYSSCLDRKLFYVIIWLSVYIHVSFGQIPTNSAGLIEYRAHPFWGQKYCPTHEMDSTPRCCSCERVEVSNIIISKHKQILYIFFCSFFVCIARMSYSILTVKLACSIYQSKDAQYISLGDGRKLCLECLNTSIMDTGECQPVYHEIRDFYEGMHMKITQQVPMLLVERQALNEAIEGEKDVSFTLCFK